MCCLGELNDVELGAESVNASILQENPWLKVRQVVQTRRTGPEECLPCLFCLTAHLLGYPGAICTPSLVSISMSLLFTRSLPVACIKTSAIQRVLLPDSSALTNSNDREKKLVRAGRIRAAAAMLTVTDLEVLSGFLLPVLQETIQGELTIELL